MPVGSGRSRRCCHKRESQKSFMSLISNLRRATRSLRRRNLPPISDNVTSLNKEIGVLGAEIERLRAEQERTAASGLNDRLRQLEILLTEHSKTISGGPAVHAS